MRTFLVTQEQMDSMQADKHYGTAIRVGDDCYTISKRVPYAVISDRIAELSAKGKNEAAADLLVHSVCVAVL